MEVIVESAQGPGRRGSGYRITGSTVLTASHVVSGAVQVRVRCNADTSEEWTQDARVLGQDGDLAVLAVGRPDELTPVRYGRVPERDAVLACTGLGFPRFKFRGDASSGTYRDLCHLVGSAPVLSNRRSGTLEITVSSPPDPDPDPAYSAWEGMSGAPVFAAGRLIAVVTANHALEGAGRLEAHRIDALYRSGADEFRDALGLPPLCEDLPDVLPPVTRSLELEMHQAEVASIAPLRLFGRDAELAELTEFCSGTDPYLWWQAGPWAGKTALVSSFSVAPPDGVRVVSFFITARLAGQADAAAFSSSVIRQLSEIAERPLPLGAGGPGLLALLLTEAAGRCAGRGERLVLVVDGLDEDQGARPSVAALLPRRPPDNLRVLVTSRHHPGLPDDVPGDHPLRSCRIRPLKPSAYAQDLELRARAELNDLVRSGPDGSEVVALFTASGGGLTSADLAELTERRYYEVVWDLDSVFGRAFTDRRIADDQVFLFAHETLRDTAEQFLGPELPAYRDRLYAWALRYRDLGWPDGTPRYLLEPYARMLAERAEADRLAELALDWRRHDRMLARFRTDSAALGETDAARELLAGAPDLTRPALLALERNRLADRSTKVPNELAAVWARLGYLGHAAELSEFLYDEPLAEYGLALVEAGHYDDAAEVARQHPGYDQLAVWAALLRRAVAEDPDQVGALTAGALATMEAMPTYSATLELLIDLLDILRPFPANATLIVEKVPALVDDSEPSLPETVMEHLQVSLAMAPNNAERALLIIYDALRAFGTLSEVGRISFSGVMVCGLLRTAAVVGPAWTEERLGAEIDSVLEASRGARLMYGRSRGLSALAEADGSRAGEWAQRYLAEFLALDEQAVTNAGWDFDLDIIYGWRELLSVLTRTGRQKEVRALLRHPLLPLRPRVEACCALVRHARDGADERHNLLLEAAEWARRSAEGPDLLAQMAAASVDVDRTLAVELATEAEQRAREHPHYDTWEKTKECLARALVRLGRPDAVEDVYRAGGMPASLRADMALAHARTAPEDTLRLLSGVDDRARWRGPDGQPLQKISIEDLAKASAALEELAPDRARILVERAIARVRGRTNADKRWKGLFDVLTHAAPNRAERVLGDFAEDLRATDDWPPLRQYGLARALLHLDQRRAARLVGQVPHTDREELQSVDRIAVLAVTAPDLAVEPVERMFGEDYPLLMDELAEALIGDPKCPGNPALRPLARRCVRVALTETHWETALPPLAVLEPEAVLAVYERMRDLGVVGAS